MSNNPDVYLLYEYMDKLPFTVRFKVQLDAPVDADLLDRAAPENFSCLPISAQNRNCIFSALSA